MSAIYFVFLRFALALLLLSFTPMVIAQDRVHAGIDTGVTVVLTSQQRKENGVVIAIAEKRSFKEPLTAPGEVVLNAYQSSKVTPRIASHTLARHVLLGETVIKGQPLVRLSSVEMARAQGDLIIAANEWERVKEIGRQTVSGRRYTEAQVAIQQAMARVQTFGMTQQQVKDFLANEDASHATGAYELLAPQNGTVISDNFLVGERIEPGQVLFELTDESSLWVDARVRTSDAQLISEEISTQISVDGVRWIAGEIVQIAHSLDDQTRTRMVRIEVDNQDDWLHPGEFVQVEFLLGNDSKVLAVPASSIVTLGGLPAIFRMMRGDELRAVFVETGRTAKGWVEIHAGIAAGDEIAIEGAFALKAELLKLQGGD